MKRPIIARRVWDYDATTGFISSIFAPVVWYPHEVMIARPISSDMLSYTCPTHKSCSTQNLCLTGIYGIKLSVTKIDDLLIRGVLGKVALWGTVMEHTQGWRGQYAYPLSFDHFVCMLCKEAISEGRSDQFGRTMCDTCANNKMRGFSEDYDIQLLPAKIEPDALTILRDIYL